jgi:hypothetical protein
LMIAPIFLFPLLLLEKHIRRSIYCQHFLGVAVSCPAGRLKYITSSFLPLSLPIAQYHFNGALARAALNSR